MSHLSQPDRSAIQSALEAQRSHLLAILKTAMEESGETQFTEVLGRASGDSGDEALAVTLGDLSAARLEHELRAFKSLEAARKRINDPDFGLCADCGDVIPTPRLIANPAATRCVKCQEVYEHTHAGQSHGSL